MQSLNSQKIKKITDIKVLKRYKFFPNKKINVQYIFPLVSVFILVFHTFYVLFKHNFKYLVTELDDLWTHRMTPKVVHFQGDVVINMALGLEIFTYGKLIFDPLLLKKYRLYATEKNHNLVIILNKKSKFLNCFVYFNQKFK